MAKARKATAGERHVARWNGRSVREVRLDPNSRKEANQIDCGRRRAILDEKDRCYDIVYELMKEQPHNTPARDALWRALYRIG